MNAAHATPRILALLMVSLVWQTVLAQTKPAPASPAGMPRFADISRASGLTVSHISSPDKKYIIESVSGGVGFIDCDNDGKLDIITERIAIATAAIR
jgi:enediyne biosynthesis protein E4